MLLFVADERCVGSSVFGRRRGEAEVTCSRLGLSHWIWNRTTWGLYNPGATLHSGSVNAAIDC